MNLDDQRANVLWLMKTPKVIIPYGARFGLPPRNVRELLFALGWGQLSLSRQLMMLRGLIKRNAVPNGLHHEVLAWCKRNNGKGHNGV
jgi:hypothetical protein